jgi:hypothetical protein
MIINIDKVELALVRIKEKNSENYLVIPAWKIYGDAVGRVTGEALDTGIYGDGTDYVSLFGMVSYSSRNIVTINALDGSVIDMELGY